MKDFLTNLLLHASKTVTILWGLWTVVSVTVGNWVQMVNEMTAWALDNIPPVVLPNYQIELSDYEGTLALVNHFFPLSESWALMVATVPIWIFIVVIKQLKKLIPGLG